MRALGLFLEGKSVKIAIVSKVKNQLTLERIGEFDDIPYELLQEKNLHLVTALSSEDVVRREVTLKLSRHSAVLKALPFQLESLLPFSLEETIVHPFFYPSKEKTDVVVFATTRLALKKHLTGFQEKNVDPDQVSSVPIALARFARLLFLEQSISWVYTNNLKNREFDKKGPQNFCSERATIAERLRTLTNSPVDCFSGKQVNEVNWPEGGASENKNSEAAESKKRSEGPFSRGAGEQSELARRDPTQSKTDSSSCLCIYQSTALALEGEKIVFSQCLEDKGRLETYLKSKYAHHFSIPSQLPTFQEYSSDQLMAFATPIGLALDGLHDTPCQFRQNDFTSSKKLKRDRFLKIGTWASCLGVTLLTLVAGQWMLYREETILKKRIAAHFSATGSLEEQLLAWQKKLYQEGQEFPLLPDVPTVRDVMAWLGALQEPIEVVHFHYGLVQYPRIDDKTQPYQVKVELEFTAGSPAIAHRFQEALEKAPTLVDKKQKVAWTSNQDSYKLSFVLRKI